MTSKEALEKLSYIPIYKEDEHNVITDIDSCCIYKGDLCEVYGNEFDTIEKDLKVLEILKRRSTKLDDEDWTSNIFNGIDYEYLDKEERKVIKEWLENDK